MYKLNHQDSAYNLAFGDLELDMYLSEKKQYEGFTLLVEVINLGIINRWDYRATITHPIYGSIGRSLSGGDFERDKGDALSLAKERGRSWLISVIKNPSIEVWN